LIRVEWKGGTVDELRTPRPKRSEWRSPSPHALSRLRQLAAEGEHDQGIAARLNAEGIRTGTGGKWTLPGVIWARRKHGIARTAPDRPRMKQMPDRRADGRYSIRGVMKRFQVSSNVVHAWIRRGLLDAVCDKSHRKRKSWWIRIDAEAEQRLAAEAVRSRARSAARRSRGGGGPAS
jgi:hypothetical protein